MCLIAVAAVIAVTCIVAYYAGGGAIGAVAALYKLAAGTAVGTATSLVIGGTIAGIQSAVNGNGYWNGFSKHGKQNFVQALITSFVFAAVFTCVEFMIRYAPSGNSTSKIVDEPLDWSRKRRDGLTTEEHVRLHEKADIGKKTHSVFNGDSVQMINEAWANRAGAIIDNSGYNIVYNIPYANAGITGGYSVVTPQVCNGIAIVIQRGTTNLLVTAYPIII